MTDQLAEKFEKDVVLNQPEFEYLQKWLNNRQFEGCRTGRGFLTLDEYCKLIDFYQNWRRDSDEAILRYIAASFTGRALTWWSNNVNKVTSLKQLEKQLRLRFGHETELRAKINLFKRQQRVDEPLLDYIDETVYFAQRIEYNKSEMTENWLIGIILATVHDKYRDHFFKSGLEFNTLEELTRYAACLVRMLSSENDNQNH